MFSDFILLMWNKHVCQNKVEILTILGADAPLLLSFVWTVGPSLVCLTQEESGSRMNSTCSLEAGPSVNLKENTVQTSSLPLRNSGQVRTWKTSQLGPFHMLTEEE